MRVPSDLVIIDDRSHSVVPLSVRDAALELGSCLDAIGHVGESLRPSFLVPVDVPVSEAAGDEVVGAIFEDREQIG